MRVHWNPNPLRTIVELGEHESERLRLGLKIEALEDRLFDASYYLALSDLQSVRNELEYDKRALEARVDELLAECTAALKGEHYGDCTSAGGSCTKCRAESILGIETISGLGNKGNYVADAFGRFDPDTGTRGPDCAIDEAILRLDDFDPQPPADGEKLKDWALVGGFERHIPHWKEEAAAVAIWLKAYRDEHFGDRRRGPVHE